MPTSKQITINRNYKEKDIVNLKYPLKYNSDEYMHLCRLVGNAIIGDRTLATIDINYQDDKNGFEIITKEKNGCVINKRYCYAK